MIISSNKNSFTHLLPPYIHPKIYLGDRGYCFSQMPRGQRGTISPIAKVYLGIYVRRQCMSKWVFIARYYHLNINKSIQKHIKYWYAFLLLLLLLSLLLQLPTDATLTLFYTYIVPNTWLVCMIAWCNTSKLIPARKLNKDVLDNLDDVSTHIIRICHRWKSSTHAGCLMILSFRYSIIISGYSSIY